MGYSVFCSRADYLNINGWEWHGRCIIDPTLAGEPQGLVTWTLVESIRLCVSTLTFLNMPNTKHHSGRGCF